MDPLKLAPGTAAKLLGISYQTLKYWKDSLDPRDNNGRYTGRDLIAYSVIKALIRERYCTPEILSQFPMHLFFELILSSKLEELRNQVLILDVRKKHIYLKPDLTIEEASDTQFISISLSKVIDKHFSDFANR